MMMNDDIEWSIDDLSIAAIGMMCICLILIWGAALYVRLAWG